MKPNRGGEPIARPLIWKFVPDELIRWNDAAGLSSAINNGGSSGDSRWIHGARDRSKEGFLDAIDRGSPTDFRKCYRSLHPFARIQDRQFSARVYVEVEESSRFR